MRVDKRDTTKYISKAEMVEEVMSFHVGKVIMVSEPCQEGLRKATDGDDWWWILDTDIGNISPLRRAMVTSVNYVDDIGQTVHIKRSKCRHYYKKVAGKIQRRISVDEVRREVSI